VDYNEAFYAIGLVTNITLNTKLNQKKMETQARIKSKIAWGLFIILCCIISFITGMNYKPITVIQTQFDSITYKAKLDSLNGIIQANKDTIQILTDKKAIVKIKYKKIYLNLDSTTFDEILWEHGLLDDTTVQVNEHKIVLFRLVQGAEARALNIIQEIEINKLHSIISDMAEIRQNDSTAISYLTLDNLNLNKAYLNASTDLTSCKLRLDKLEDKRRSKPFKIAAILSGGFIGGVFVGLIR